MWEANYCHCSDEIWIAEKFCLEQYPGLGLSKLMFKAFSVCSYVCLSFTGFFVNLLCFLSIKESPREEVSFNSKCTFFVLEQVGKE